MPGHVVDTFLAALALGDVCISAYDAATFDRNALDFDHLPVRTHAVVTVRPIENAATANEIEYVLLRMHELVPGPLICQYLAESRSRRH